MVLLRREVFVNFEGLQRRLLPAALANAASTTRS